jgi:hypothetical protein
LQLNPRAPGFREPNCNGLLGGRGTVLAFSHVMHLFPHEFSRLSARRLSLAGIFSSAFDRLFFRHI